MNSAAKQESETIVKDLPVTVFLRDMPEQYFFGVADVYGSGMLYLYTNGRIQEDENVLVKPREESGEEKAEVKSQDYTGRVEGIQLSSNPNHMFTYEYSVVYGNNGFA